MTITKLRKLLDRALQRVGDKLAQEHKYSSIPGLVREGWMGGYEQALRDMELMSRDIFPNDSRSYWMWME
jgi:hypothetical protein